jgi:hypothetical protein
VIIDQRGDHNISPKARPILAPAPALVFIASRARRLLQCLTRQALFLVFRRVEGAEQFANGFMLAPADNPLGAEIPGRNPAARIHHKDRVILQAFDHHSKALLALPDCL